MVELPLLVTGTPRSGTKYTAWVLQDVFGMDCPHEKLGAHGTVSSLYCVDDPDDYFGPHGNDPPAGTVHFQKVIRLVREPLSNIGSMQAQLPPDFWIWQERHTGIAMVPAGEEKTYHPTSDQVAEFYCAWHKIIPDDAQVLRLEDIWEIGDPVSTRTRELAGGTISPEWTKKVTAISESFGY